MNGNEGATMEAWFDEWRNLPEAEKALIRTTIKALDKNRIQAQAMAAQEAKIAEQAALLQRYDNIITSQAFDLGGQDLELRQLRSRAKAAEAGDLATLRINNAFQHSEIMRLKAALAEREGDCLDALAEVQSYKEGQRAFGELKTANADLRDELTIKTNYAAGLLDAVKALNLDVTRLKGIADHSNNLAQNRLEELAKLRRELAVAREASAKLDDMVIRSRSEAEQLTTALAQSETIRSEQRQAIGQLTTALAEAREAARFQAGDLQCWRFVADHATLVRFQEMREAAQSERSNFTWYKLQPTTE